MTLSSSAAAIIFIACHGGPADHFATFAEELVKKGHSVQVYATEPALEKMRTRNIQQILITPFSLEHSYEEESILIAKQCAKAAVVITDVGHSFDISLQKALSEHAVEVLRLSYYDNPENYVPGGYSSVAAQVMLAAQGVLFANARLAKMPIYQAPSQELSLNPDKRIGLGYYPVATAEKIAQRRVSERQAIRTGLLSHYSLEDRGQKVLVYTGGNNEDYFSQAFPAFLQFLEAAIKQGEDLSSYVILLQQHPGARAENRDGQLLREWLDVHTLKSNAPQFYRSELNSEDSQVVADGMLYYQTSMSPQFALAGIPTIQVGHQVYDDILVRNGLCITATGVSGLVTAFSRLAQNQGVDQDAIKQGLGISVDWADKLESAIQSPITSSKAQEIAWVRKVVEQYPEILWLAETSVRKTEEGIASTTAAAYSEQLFGKKQIEFDRTIMTLRCLRLILDGSDLAYQEFTAAQPEDVKLSRSSFAQLHARGVGLVKSNYQGMSESEMTRAMEAALVLGDIGKSETPRTIFRLYGANAPDHDDFHGEVMPILEQHPQLCPTFNRLPSSAQQLLRQTANLAHYGHMTHIEGGPSMFSKLKQSGITTASPVALAFDWFVHTCDVCGALGHINNRSSLVYTELVHKAMQGVSDACMTLTDPAHKEIDAYNAYLSLRAGWLGLNAQDRMDRALTRIGSMLRLFTPEEGGLLKRAVLSLSQEIRDRIITQLDTQEGEELRRTPTYMPAVLVNLLNNSQLGSSREQRMAQAVTLGLPFLARVLEQHKQFLASSEANPLIPLNFNKAAGLAKTAPDLLRHEFVVDRDGNVYPNNFKSRGFDSVVSHRI